MGLTGRFLLAKCEDYNIRHAPKEVHHGIVLCDVNFDESDDEKFFKISKEAIDLIAKTDQRRFRRVQNELKYIINQELLSGGEYRRRIHACVIDFGRYEFDKDYEWCLYQYAGTIIHEATHGYLFAKKINYTLENKVQIEKICCTEENRFFKKLDCEFKDQLIEKFDEKGWDFCWHASKWEKTKAMWQRIRESFKKNDNKKLKA